MADRARVAVPRPSPAYALSVLAVALISALVPLAYLALIALVASAAWLYAVHASGLITGVQFGLLGLALYLGPIAAGVIAVVFLLQPLFARRLDADVPLTLTREREPRLVAFVEELCDLADAPRPAAIRVTIDTNASAGLQAWGIGRDAFVVTFGLPLAATLDVPSFASILVHELAHCRQGLAMQGMRATQAIDRWLATALRQRPGWERAFAAGAESLLSALVVGPALIAVRATHRVLLLLGMGATVVSAGLSRRMEVEADRLAALVAGSEAAASALERLGGLQVARERTAIDIGNPTHRGRLPDDLVACVKAAFERLSPGDWERLAQRAATSPVTRYDTHPSVAERVHNMRALGAPGVLDRQGAAADLLDDIGGLSRELTRAAFERAHGPLSDGQLVPTAEFLARVERSARARNVVRRFFGLERTLYIDPLVPGPADDPSGAPTRSAAECMAALRDGARAQERACEEKHEKAVTMYAAQRALVHGLRFDAGLVGIEPAAIIAAGSLEAAIDRALATALAERIQAVEELEPLRHAATTLIRDAVARRATASAQGACDAAAAEHALLVRLVDAAGCHRESLAEAALCRQAVNVVLTRFSSSDRDDLERIATSLTRDAAVHIRPVLSAVLAVEWPPDVEVDEPVRSAWQALYDSVTTQGPLDWVMYLLGVAYEATLASLLQHVGLAEPDSAPDRAFGLTDGEVTVPGQPPEPATPVVQRLADVLRRRTPRLVAVPALGLAYLVAFVAMAGTRPLEPTTVERLVESGAAFRPLVATGDWWRVLSACVLPDGPFGLVVTLAALLAFGAEAERVLGNAVFAGCYLVIGVVAATATMLVDDSAVFTTSAMALLGVAVLLCVIHSDLFTSGGIGDEAGCEPVLAFPPDSRIRVFTAVGALLLLVMWHAPSPMGLTVACAIAFAMAKYVANAADVRKPPLLPAAVFVVAVLVASSGVLASFVGAHDMRSAASTFLVADRRDRQAFARACEHVPAGSRIDEAALGRIVERALQAGARARSEARLRYIGYQRDFLAAGRLDRFERVGHLQAWLDAQDQIVVGTAYLGYLDSRDAAWRQRLIAAQQSKADVLADVDRADARARADVWKAVTHHVH